MFQTSDVGAIFQGLAATPTGTDAAEILVANFTDAATLLLLGEPSLSVANPPVVHTPSAALGSTFKIAMQGTWQATFFVLAQTAATVQAGLGVDNLLAERSGNIQLPVTAGGRILARSARIAAGADTDSLTVVGRPFVVTRAMALLTAAAAAATGARIGRVRALLGNGANAGATAASIGVASCYLMLLRIGEVPAYLAQD